MSEGLWSTKEGIIGPLKKLLKLRIQKLLYLGSSLMPFEAQYFLTFCVFFHLESCILPYFCSMVSNKSGLDKTSHLFNFIFQLLLGHLRVWHEVNATSKLSKRKNTVIPQFVLSNTTKQRAPSSVSIRKYNMIRIRQNYINKGNHCLE